MRKVEERSSTRSFVSAGSRGSRRILDSSVHVGRRTEGHDEFAIVVTTWTDWHALTEALGPDPSQPYLLTPESGLVETATVEHFEAIELPPRPHLQPAAEGSDGLLVAPPIAT